MEVDQVPGASEGAGDTGETTESAAELKAKLHSEVLNHIDQNSQNGYSSANDESSRQADSSKDHRDSDRHSSKHHSSPDKHKHSSSSSDKHKHSSSSDKHRSSSDKHHSSSSSKHKDGSSSSHKHSSSSSHRTSSDKHKDGHSSSSSSKHREGGSSSSKDKHSHSSSSKDKHPSSSSSNKHSSSSDKHSSSSDKHSSSSDKHKHSSSDKHKHSSPDKHKHSSSSSKHKESSDKHKDRSSEHRDKDKHSSSKHKDSSRSHSSHKHINSKKENVDVDNDEQRQLEKERQAEKIKLEAEMREAHENGMSEDLDQLSPERLPSSPVKSTIKEEPESSDDDEDVPLSVRLKQETVVKPMKQEVDMKPVKRQLEESDDDDDDEPLAVRKEKVKKVKRETPEPKSIKRKVEESESEDERPVPKKKQKKKVKAEVKEESVSPKKKAKKGKAEEPTVWKWWEEDKQDSLVKWNFLEHKGPVFAPPYERLPKNVKFYYDGKPMILSEDTEEVATFYGKMLEHDYTTKDVFNSNFMKCWRKEMNAEEREKLTDLKKCNFREMCEYFKEESEKRKTRSKEQRLKLKEENQQLMDEYGYCTMDGHKEKIGNFRIEPPGLFRGRGEHPKQGMLKKRTVAKDIIINCSKDSVIPQPPKGHKWKRVQFDNKVTWLASWNENIQGSTKYVMLNASSRLKGEKDWQKYETARHLHRCVDKIRANYQQNWRSKEMRIRQRSVALYFIDKLALRAGNEKEEGESADTVGCCSLRVEHVSLFPEKDGKQFVVQFDFLGKDSIRYVNTVAVEKQVYKNLQMFTENKQPGDDLFDRLNTVIMNKHLHELMDGLTAKVFRTYNASRTLQEQLDIMTNEEDPVTAKMLSYNRANRAVAILCNHQRAAPKNFSTQMENIMGKIKEKRGHVKEAKKQLKEAKANFKAGKNQKNKMVYEKKKKALERIEEQLTKLEVQATDKDENKEIALGTSKLNYLDPRISVAWCKKWEVPIEKVYNKTQRDKFRWAIDMVGPEFHF